MKLQFHFIQKHIFHPYHFSLPTLTYVQIYNKQHEHVFNNNSCHEKILYTILSFTMRHRAYMKDIEYQIHKERGSLSFEKVLDASEEKEKKKMK